MRLCNLSGVRLLRRNRPGDAAVFRVGCGNDLDRFAEHQRDFTGIAHREGEHGIGGGEQRAEIKVGGSKPARHENQEQKQKTKKVHVWTQHNG